jgi:hypothetical protein
MAIRFAVASGDYNNTAIWETPTIPTASDDVWVNGNTVAITGSITASSLNNGPTPIMLYDPAIPIMTSNTAPAGYVASSTNPGAQLPWQAFDRNTGTYFQSTVAVTTLQLQFPVSKSIQRYAIKRYGSNYDPQRWNFEGSNNGTTWTVIHGPVTSSVLVTTDYYSPVLNNTGSFGYYRLNVSANLGQITTIIPGLDMTENTSSITSSYTNTTGGTFAIASGSTVNATFNGGAGTYLLNVAFNAPGTASFIGNFNGTSTVQGSVQNGAGLLITGTGRVNWTGNIIGSLANVSSYHGVRITGNATFNLIGNLTAGNSVSNFGQGNNSTGLSNGGVSTINITGNVTAGTSIFNYGIYNAGLGSTINITGNSLAGATTLASGECAAVYNNAANSIINITGIATAVPTAYCIYNGFVSSYINISGPLYNASNGVSALVSAKSYIRTTPFNWMFTKLDTTSVGLYTQDSVGGAPSGSDVRAGVYYGIGGGLTGSCYVPLPQYVSQGVLVDNTSGSAVLTAADFLSAISSSSDPLAVRLRNVSTVDTNGAQLSALL